MQTADTSLHEQTAAAASARGKAPVFVLGSPRSGTTLLYHMLLSAGNFAVYRAESQVFNLLEPRFGDLRHRSNRRRMFAAWRRSSLFAKTGLDAQALEDEVMSKCENAGDFLRLVMEAMARQQGVERWADCTPEHLLSLGRIKQTIPNALVVHIIRDGRDVALSMERQHWIRPFPWDRGKELLTAGLYWEWMVNKGREDGRALGPDYFEVRYEDLVESPRSTLAALGDFIAQPLDYDHIQQVGIGSVSRPNSSFASEGSQFQPVARWRNAAGSPQLRDLEALIGETLRSLGYESSGAGSEPVPSSWRRMRTRYRAYFNAKHALKTRTPLGQMFAEQNLDLAMAHEAALLAEQHIEPAKILQIGNYPPPMCGWAIQLKLVTEELRRRGHICDVLKINEGRQIKSPEYVDVQSGPDYLKKIAWFAFRGYRLNVHVNGMSKKGYGLALAAALMARLAGQPALITFHGGLAQDYFPRRERSLARSAFQVLFSLAGDIACDSQPIREAIVEYGVRPEKVQSIATFSPQYLEFVPRALPDAVETFLNHHPRVLVSYVSFRPEYRLDVLREGMRRYRGQDPGAGYIWLGFPPKELPAAEEFVRQWPEDERASLLLLGNLDHDQFLTLLSRSYIYLRTPACDGVAASVLEALALGVPVVASANGRRPAGVVTYEDADVADMVAKLVYVREHYAQVKAGLRVDDSGDNVGRMADWLVGKPSQPARQPAPTAR